MNVNVAYNNLLELCGEDVKLERETFNGKVVWCIRWMDNGEWTMNRICLAKNLNDLMEHSTPGSAFTEWYLNGCHFNLSCFNGMPQQFKNWFKHIQGW